MLYGDKVTDLTMLADVLKEVGIPEAITEKCIRYMEGDAPDDTLLENIGKIGINRSSLIVNGVKLKRVNDKLFEKVVKNDLVPQNRELYERFIVFLFEAAGISGAGVIFESLYLNSSNNKEEIRIEALKRRFPDEAEAIELAMRAYYYMEVMSTANYRASYVKADDPSLCMKAIEMLDKYGSGGAHFPAKTALCVLSLDKTPLPDEDPSVKDFPDVKTACETLKNLYLHGGRVPADIFNLIGVGLAEAAHFSPLAKPLFKRMAETSLLGIAQAAYQMKAKCKRISAVVEKFPQVVTADYIRFVNEHSFFFGREHIRKLAEMQPKMFRTVLDSTTNVTEANSLIKILSAADPDFDASEYDIRGKVQRRAVRVLEKYSRDNPESIRAYLKGEGSYEDIAPIFKGLRGLNNLSGDNTYLNYYSTFGADDFFKRIFTIAMISNSDGWCIGNMVWRNTGFHPINDEGDKEHPVHEAMTVQFMLDGGAPLTDIISYMGLAIDAIYNKTSAAAAAERTAKAAAKYPDLLAECNIKQMGVGGRVIYAHAIAEDTERFKNELAALADDSSKVVRAEVAAIYKEHKELADDVKALLAAKKIAKREIALTVIEEWGAEGFGGELQKALDSEKNDKLRVRIAALIGTESAAEAVRIDPAEQIKKLMRGASKLGWLYTAPFKPVHRKDGTEADEDYLKAIMLCYASMEKLARNQFACELAEALDQRELEVFAKEVFGRWFDKGAEAKTKWVLYFSAVHGGRSMCVDLLGHIKSWGEYSFNMRTAIAGEAVKALAMNGSSEALMAVDNIARKFKSKSVRVAANDAMAAAADGLGITAEELADRIVPDLGFDEKLCRVFDYGKRQFSVYIRPSLELEIFSGGKQIKSMPKPAASDDAEKANAAYEDFKEMKKVMKTAVSTQKQRLEYVLMCDRKWSAEGWRELFVKNAVMHCFAIGLIWGVYEDGKLGTTFRYMEDGSFTTSDGDEFELPENAVIGLVHPIELSEELKAEWTEQLSDFEIVQPFPQLSRRVFTPNAEELEQNKIMRFNGCEIGDLSFIGRMTKLGWYKGQAEDAGYFYYFIREDVSSRRTAPDGSPVLKGFGAFLRHSGMYISPYNLNEGEETVGAEELVFFKAGTSPDYYDKEEKGFLKCSEVPVRYFSEVILQLTSVLGGGDS